MIDFPFQGRRSAEHILDEAADWVCNGLSTFAVKKLQKFLIDFVALATNESHQILFITHFAALLYSRLVAHFERIEEGINAMRDCLCLTRNHKYVHGHFEKLFRGNISLWVLKIHDLSNNGRYGVLHTRTWHENLKLVSH